MCILKSTISAYENDRVDIKGSELIELLRILETTPNYLLGAEETKIPKTKIDLELEKALEEITNEDVKRILLAQIRGINLM